MEYRITRAVKNQIRVSYALGAETPPCEVDCGEGVNVELASPAAISPCARRIHTPTN